MSELATLPNVPIVTVGSWDASTGPFNATRSWCMDAVAAYHNDPGIIAPRAWAGHRPDELRDGEPALGVFTDMRWSEEDLTIYADILTLKSIAEAAPVLFPNRSIEAWSNFTSPATGRTYEGVIDGLALLGVEWPAVPVLEDLTRLATGDLSVLTINKADALTERIAATANAGTGARRVVAAGCFTTREAHVPATADPARVAAQMEMDAVWRAFYAMCEATPGREWWWIRADLVDPVGLIVQADDMLMQIDVSVSGTDIAFAEPVEVVVQYAPKDSGGGGDEVAASVGKPLRVAAAYVNASATRQATNTGDDMNEDDLRKAVGMPDEPIADVLAAVAEKFGTAGGNDPAGTDDGDDGDEGIETPNGDPVPTPVDASGKPLVQTIETARLERLEASAAEGKEARRMLAEQHREKVLTKHRARGAIVGADDSDAMKTWRSEFDRNPAGTEKLLETLASGKVPVDGERGTGVDPGTGNAGAHTPEAHAARMALHGRQSTGIPTDTKGA